MRPAEDALRISDRMSIAGFRSWLQDWSELAKARLSLLVLLTTLVGLYCGAGGVLEPWRTFFHTARHLLGSRGGGDPE